MQIRKGCKYKYVPVPLDIFTPCIGAKKGFLFEGDIVKVIAPPGMPKAKTINCNHVYIDVEINGKWEFAGLIHINSLEKI